MRIKKLVKIDFNNSKHISFLKLFLKNAGNSLETFRYFSSRDLTCIKSHIVTYLLFFDKKVVGYGHLDHDKYNKIWLGVCISENNKGKGFGKLIVESLINFAISSKKVPQIRLSVDKNNIKAINLYKYFNFNIIKEDKKNYYMLLNLKSGEENV